MDSASSSSFAKSSNESGSNSNKKRKLVEEIDPLNDILTKKYKRTKVFAGSKRAVNPEVTSLKDSCVHLLKKNIDAIKCTNGVPFDILEPVLKFATPKQLHRIEKNNLYLAQSTNKLWEYHTKKDFRNEFPGADETWKEVYNKCLAERNNRYEVQRMILESNLLKNRKGIAPAPSAKWIKEDDTKNKKNGRTSKLSNRKSVHPYSRSKNED